MSLYQRGKRGIWHTEFEYEGQRYKRSTGTHLKKEAQEFDRELRQSLKERYKRRGDRPSKTLAEVVDRYFMTIIKPKSRLVVQKNCMYDLGVIEQHFGSGTLIENITPADIADFQASLFDGRASATINKYMARLRAVLNKAIEWGELTGPITVPMLSVNNERTRWLNGGEEKALLEAAPDWMKDLLIFYLDTGARKQEALSLVWSEAHLDHHSRPFVRFMDTKGGKPRSVPLPLRCQKMLRERYDKRTEGEDCVFLYPRPERRGGKTKKPREKAKVELVPVGDFKKSWATVKESAEIVDFNIHDLRHTYASRLVLGGVPLFDVSKLLGHKSIAMTMRYAHLAPEALDSAVAVLD